MTVSTALSNASSLEILNLSFRCMSETPRYAATHFASHDNDTSISCFNALPCDTMSALNPCSMIVLVASL